MTTIERELNYVGDTMDKLRYYDFFAGAGLVRLALDKHWECVFANDIDPKKAEVYIKNFGNKEFLLDDVSNVKASILPKNADMAWASFPCQDLSLAGGRKGIVAERSGTFWAFWRIMMDLFDKGQRPPVIVIENVMGLLHGENFVGLCESLAALGLQFGALVIDAKHFLPQSRPRVFVVAVDTRVDVSKFVETPKHGDPWYPKAVTDAYSNLPNNLKDLWRWWKLPVYKGERISLDSIIEDEPTLVQWHSEEETNYLIQLMTEKNRKKVEQALKSGKRTIGLLYRRTRNKVQRAEVRFDGIAGCLRTPRGGSSRQIVLIVEKGKVRSRLLSPREAARLMGVPDTYVLPESYNTAYAAMGDGVAVHGVSWLSEQLLVPLTITSRNKMKENVVFKKEVLVNYRKNAEQLAFQWEGI